MRKTFIQIGGYLALILGILISLALMIIAIIVFINYPEANLQKKIFVSLGIFIGAIIILILTIAFFEVAIETSKLDELAEELEEEIEEEEKNQSQALKINQPNS